MEVIEEPLPGLKLLRPRVFEDSRGYFFESYSETVFEQLGINDLFVQDNESLSARKGVLRGLHFQNPPFAQAKLVRVIKGSVLDVVVDIRRNSPQYGKHFAVELNERNKQILYIPTGFAHGFVTLEENSIFSYKCSMPYHPASEQTIAWNDPELNINWEVESPILSEKDKKGLLFSSFKSLF